MQEDIIYTIARTDGNDNEIILAVHAPFKGVVGFGTTPQTAIEDLKAHYHIFLSKKFFEKILKKLLAFQI